MRVNDGVEVGVESGTSDKQSAHRQQEAIRALHKAVSQKEIRGGITFRSQRLVPSLTL